MLNYFFEEIFVTDPNSETGEQKVGGSKNQRSMQELLVLLDGIARDKLDDREKLQLSVLMDEALVGKGNFAPQLEDKQDLCSQAVQEATRQFNESNNQMQMKLKPIPGSGPDCSGMEFWQISGILLWSILGLSLSGICIWKLCIKK